MNPEFVRPGEDDWEEFLAVAGAEGWRVPATELALFRGPFADSVLALRCRGRFGGLVTFVHHGASAWIGNLIVPPDLRGRGYGKRLFDRSLRCLGEKQAGSVWLTASEAGFPLYRRQGFDTVGRVERWALAGEGGRQLCVSVGKGPAEEDSLTANALRMADARVWGGHRRLLDLLLETGRPFACGGSTVLLQQGPGLQILGPWFSDGAGEDDHRQLLALAISSARPGGELVADVLAGAVPPPILQEAGFILQGSTRLMVRGDASGIAVDRLVSLASLGSMG